MLCTQYRGNANCSRRIDERTYTWSNSLNTENYLGSISINNAIVLLVIGPFR